MEMASNFKQKPIRDKKHLSFIRKLNCAVCGMWPTEACHIRKFGDGGMGMKPSDSRCIPMCHECHAEQHRIGEEKFFGDIQKPIELSNALWLMTGDLERCKDRVTQFRRSIRT